MITLGAYITNYVFAMSVYSMLAVIHFSALYTNNVMDMVKLQLEI